MTISALDPGALEHALAIRDLSDPAQGPCAIQLLVTDAVNSLSAVWGCPAWLRRGSPIVDVSDNYDVLRYPPDDVTRATRYSRYVNERQLLRTHTSAMIPPLLRLLGEQGEVKELLLACPGITYRRDVIDRLHTGEPHQLDLWRVVGHPKRAERDCLLEMISTVSAALLPGFEYHVQDTEHWYTLEGLELHVRSAQGEWVEIGECGLIHPEVLLSCGQDPRRIGGLAMGLGLDRILMLRKGIDDVRLLRSNDPRVSRQMLDLAPYRPVSRMPSVRRDLSLVIDAELDAEMLGDRVRMALGERARLIEELSVLAEYDYDGISAAVAARLGMNPSQKNVLLRVVLSDLDHTLTDERANELRNAIYAATHQGERSEWARSRGRL